MEYLLVILVVAVTFGLCFVVDKGYMRLFRNKAQHRSGLAVRLNQRYAVVGLVFAVLGIAAVVMGITDGLMLLLAGAAMLVAGGALIIYYMTFGVFYDDDGFILTTFGKKSTTYRFSDIKTQQIYLVQGGNVIVELQLRDGRSVSLQSAMAGTYPFLDHAFKNWCRQTGRDPEQCPFHNPSQHLWFPSEEES